MARKISKALGIRGIALRGFMIGAGLLAGAGLAGFLIYAGGVDLMSVLSDPDRLAALFQSFGPVAVVCLLALAVVVSPIPSGPIAMAAGAVLGPALGGAMTAIGAVLGAMVAFWLSRRFGYQPLSAAQFPIAEWITRPRNQSALVAAVLVSRLIPFISFDAVSYIAGLTTIRFSHFAVATALGVLPASFGFAALGAGLVMTEGPVLIILAFGVTAILPVALAAFKLWGRRPA